MVDIVPRSREDVIKAYDEYAKALGFVVYASNRLQETFARLFWHLLGGAELRISGAVWHSILSDKTQRDMLRAALNAISCHEWEARLPNAREDLGWLLKEAEKWANLRNDAVHAPCIFTTDEKTSEVRAMEFTQNRKAINLSTKSLLPEFALYTDAFDKLNWFTLHASDALGSNAISWPDRPLMPTRDHTHYRV